MNEQEKRKLMYSMVASQLYEDGYVDASYYVASATNVPQHFDPINQGSLYQSIEAASEVINQNLSKTYDALTHNRCTVENFISSPPSITNQYNRDFIEYANFSNRSVTSVLTQSSDGSMTSSSTTNGEIYLHNNFDTMKHEKKSIVNKSFRKYSDNNSEVLCLGFHPMESLLFSGNISSELKTYSFKSQEHICACQTAKDSSSIRNITPHPSGSHILYSTQNGDLRFYDVEKSEVFSSRLKSSYEKKKPIQNMSIHPFGATVSVTTNTGEIIVLDGRTTKEIDCIRDAHGHTGIVNSIVYSKSGFTLLTSGSDNNVNLWDLRKSCTVLKSISSGSFHSNSILRADFTWDEKYIICNTSVSALVGIDVCSGKPTISIPHPCAINAFSISKVSNTIVTSGSDMQLRFWDT